MKKTKESIITFLAFLLSITLHAGFFTGIGYLSRLNLNNFKINSKQDNKEIFSIETVENKDLPDISRMDKESKIRTEKEEKSNQLSEQIYGIENKKTAVKSSINEKENEQTLNFEDMIKLKIQKARNYPESARRDGLEGEVLLSFEVLKNGNLGRVNIIKSSGFEVLDNEAVNTLRRAAPFPEIPEYYNILKFNLQVRIIYKLN